MCGSVDLLRICIHIFC